MAKSAVKPGPADGGSLNSRLTPVKTAWAVVLTAGCILAVALAIKPVAVTTVRLPRSGGRLFGAVDTPPGSEIRLQYRHSVEKTAVQGRFVVGRGPALLAVETRMTSVGTGLPNTAPRRTSRDGEWIVVDEGQREIRGFDFFIAPVNQTRIVVRDTALAVQTLAAGSVVRLDVEAIRLGQWMLYRWFNKDWRKERR